MSTHTCRAPLKSSIWQVICLITISFAIVTSVACHSHKGFGEPPGQVQKRTGYNPASEKFHPLGGPPGQNKEKKKSQHKRR